MSFTIAVMNALDEITKGRKKKRKSTLPEENPSTTNPLAEIPDKDQPTYAGLSSRLGKRAVEILKGGPGSGFGGQAENLTSKAKDATRTARTSGDRADHIQAARAHIAASKAHDAIGIAGKAQSQKHLKAARAHLAAAGGAGQDLE